MRATIKDQRSNRINQPRLLSPCCQTRFHRAPEVILMDKNYNESVDIWGVGIILAELMQRTNPDNLATLTGPGKLQHKSLFMGNSCYPISPFDDSEKSMVHNSDQIFKIIEKYPNLNVSQDFCFIHSEDTLDYLDKIVKRKQFQDLKNDMR